MVQSWSHPIQLTSIIVLSLFIYNYHYYFTHNARTNNSQPVRLTSRFFMHVHALLSLMSNTDLFLETLRAKYLFYLFVVWCRSLGKLLKILWHLLNLSVVMILDFSNELGIIWQDKVDGNTLSTETTSSTNSMNVVFLLLWKFVVDNETNLLDIDTSCKKICGDKNSCCTSSELLHDCISLNLFHLTMHSWDCKVVVIHCLLEL